MNKFSLVYTLRYRFALWRGGVPFRVALNYPLPYLVSDGDPIEDADSELQYMCD